MDQQPVILFDGVCNFCNNIVRFVIKRNNKSTIHFGALQSEAGRKLLEQYKFPPDDIQTVIFIENGIAYTKSTAALRICRHLRGLWPLCYGFIIVPRFIRDGIYNWIAKNRYKWFGVRQECMIPTPEMKTRFL